jgi:hypothetical protein
MPEKQEKHEEIPTAMWKTAILIASQSFLYGYCSSALNGCIITGDDNSGSDCYHGTDSSCPKGTLYNDINMTDGEFFCLLLFVLVSSGVCASRGSVSYSFTRHWRMDWMYVGFNSIGKKRKKIYSSF